MFLNAVGQLFIISAIWTSASFGFQYYDLLKFDLKQLSDKPIMVSLKMFRIENRDYRFNVTFNVTTDDLHIYDIEASIARSAIGNNHFVLSPFRIPRKPVCDSLNNEYRERLMDDISKYSNLPNEHDPKIDYCDLLKKGNQYNIINYTTKVSSLPPFVPTGTYKFVGKLIDRNTNEIVLTLNAMTKLH